MSSQKTRTMSVFLSNRRVRNLHVSCAMGLALAALVADPAKAQFVFGGPITGIQTIDAPDVGVLGGTHGIGANAVFGQDATVINNNSVTDIRAGSPTTAVVSGYVRQASSTTGGLIVNNGTWTRNGINWSTIGVDFANNGTLALVNGNMALFENSYFNAGSNTVIGAGTTLAIGSGNDGTAFLNGGTFSGPGTLFFDGDVHLNVATRFDVENIVFDNAGSTLTGPGLATFTYKPTIGGNTFGDDTNVILEQGYKASVNGILPILNVGSSSIVDVRGDSVLAETGATYFRISMFAGTALDPSRYINNANLTIAHSRFEFDGTPNAAHGLFENKGALILAAPVDSNGVLTGGTADAVFVGSTMINTGLIDVQNGNMNMLTDLVNGGPNSGDFGRIQVASGSTLDLGPDVTLYDGRVDANGRVNFRNFTLKGDTQLYGDVGFALISQNILENGTTLTINGVQYGTRDNDWYGSGTVVFEDVMKVGGFFFQDDLNIINKNVARLGTVSNHVNDDLLLGDRTTFTNVAGATVLVDTNASFDVQKNSSIGTVGTVESQFINRGDLRLTGLNAGNLAQTQAVMQIDTVDFHNYGAIIIEDSAKLSPTTHSNSAGFAGRSAGLILSGRNADDMVRNVFHDGSSVYVGENRDLLLLSGMHTFDIDQISGNGVVQIGVASGGLSAFVNAQAFVVFNEDMTINNLGQTDGFVLGTGDLFLNNSFRMDGGTHAGDATTWLPENYLFEKADKMAFTVDAGRTLAVRGDSTIEGRAFNELVIHLNDPVRSKGNWASAAGEDLVGSGTFHVTAGSTLEDRTYSKTTIKTQFLSSAPGDDGQDARILIDGDFIVNHRVDPAIYNSAVNGPSKTTLGARTVIDGNAVARNGTLVLDQGIEGTGTLLIEAPGFVELHGKGAAPFLRGDREASTIGTLAMNGTNANALTLGTSLLPGGGFGYGPADIIPVVTTLTVSNDYNNASFGNGNDFNRYANVLVENNGSGIFAAGDSKLVVTGAVETLNPNEYVLDLGRVASGGSRTVSYALKNEGTTGPGLRGAITNASFNPDGSLNTAYVSDSRLDGLGVYAQRYDCPCGDALRLGQSTAPYQVIFNGDSVGQLANQYVKIVSNFENVATQTLFFTGSVALLPLAEPEVTTPLLWAGRRNDVLADQSSILSNNAAAGSEILDYSLSDPTAPGLNPFQGRSTGNGSVNPTESTNLDFGVTTTNVGYFEGSANLRYESRDPNSGDHGWIGDGLVDLYAQINDLAGADLTKTGGTGTLTNTGLNYVLDFGDIDPTSGPITAELSLKNIVDGVFVDYLGGEWTEIVSQGFTFSDLGDVNALASGESLGGMLLTFNPSTLANGLVEYFITFDAKSIFKGLGAFANLNLDDVDLPDITLTAKANVVGNPPPPPPPPPPTQTPAPAALTIFAAGLIALKRRKKA